MSHELWTMVHNAFDHVAGIVLQSRFIKQITDSADTISNHHRRRPSDHLPAMMYSIWTKGSLRWTLKENQHKHGPWPFKEAEILSWQSPHFQTIPSVCS